LSPVSQVAHGVSNLQNAEVHGARSTGLSCLRLKSDCLNPSLFFQINAIHGDLDHEFWFILQTNGYKDGVFISVCGVVRR